MWQSRFRKIAVLALLPLVLGGCGLPDVGTFFESAKSCSTGTPIEQATCLTSKYRDICEAGEFGLRDNLKALRKITNSDIGTRACKKRIAIAIGPVIDGQNITGTLEEQTDRQVTLCYETFGRDRTLCDARVKLKFLGSQFKAACLATIPWYTANDLMFKTVELRERAIEDAKIQGNHVYRANSKWFCHKNSRVSGLNDPRLKRIYAVPDNKMVLNVINTAKTECAFASEKRCGHQRSGQYEQKPDLCFTQSHQKSWPEVRLSMQEGSRQGRQGQGAWRCRACPKISGHAAS